MLGIQKLLVENVPLNVLRELAAFLWIDELIRSRKTASALWELPGQSAENRP